MSDTGYSTADANRSRTLIAKSNAGDNAVVSIWADPTTHRLLINEAPLLSSGSLNGQTKIAITGTAVQLTSNTLVNGVIITAKSTNVASITIGGSGVTNTVDGTGNGYILEAGSSVSFAISNTNALYVNGTAGDIISFAGS